LDKKIDEDSHRRTNPYRYFLKKASKVGLPDPLIISSTFCRFVIIEILLLAHCEYLAAIVV